jgi:hypothetical protein
MQCIFENFIYEFLPYPFVCVNGSIDYNPD